MKYGIVVVGCAALALWIALMFLRDGESSSAVPAQRLPEEPRMPDVAPDGAAAEPRDEAPVPAQAAEPAPSAAPPPAEPGPDQPPKRDLHPEPKPPGVLEPSGPVEQLREAYETTPRTRDAAEVEARIRAHFEAEEIPEDMLRSASCHQGACKVELRWAEGREQAFMQVMMGLVNEFGLQLAWEPAGPRDSRGMHPIDVYLPREP